ncbi:MAG: VWA domain-containing protein [Verrucomicrobiota bacterium]
MATEIQFIDDKLQFAEPLWFLGLLVIPLVIGLRVAFSRLSTARARRFVAPSLAGRLLIPARAGAGWTVLILELLGIAALVVALARPQKGYLEQRVEVEGRNVLIAIDVSRSMLAIDDDGSTGAQPTGKPSRLDQAKMASQDVIRALPGERIGLIAFAGNAFQQVPLTVDHMAVRESLEQMSIYAIERGGTNLSAAIETAMQSFGKTEASLKALIILTDGDNLEGDAVETARKASAEGIRIFTVGLGSPEGSIIQYKSNRGETIVVRDRDRNVVATKLDAATLKKVAEAAGGRFINPSGGKISEVLVAGVVKDLDQTGGESRDRRIPNELYQWPLGAGLCCLLLGYLAGPIARAVRRPRPSAPVVPEAVAARSSVLVVGLFLFLYGASSSRVSAGLIDEAEEAMKSRKYEKAYEIYSRILEPAPESSRRGRWGKLFHLLTERIPKTEDVYFGRGASLYELEKFEEAIADFSRSLLARDGRMQADSHYNMGNGHFRIGEKHELEGEAEDAISSWEEAIGNYEGALRINPGFEPAKTNIEITRKRIERLKNQEQEEQTQEQPQDGEQENENQESSESNEEEQQSREEESTDQSQENPSKDEQSQSQDGEQEEGEETGGDEDGEEMPRTEPGEGGDGEENSSENGQQGELGEEGKEGDVDSPTNEAEAREAGEEKSAQQVQIDPDQEVNPETGYSKMSARQLLRALSNDYKMQPLQRRKAPRYYYDDW